MKEDMKTPNEILLLSEKKEKILKLDTKELKEKNAKLDSILKKYIQYFLILSEIKNPNT